MSVKLVVSRRPLRRGALRALVALCLIATLGGCGESQTPEAGDPAAFENA